MNTLKTLSYETLAAMAEFVPTASDNDVAHYRIQDESIGTIEQRHIQNADVTVIEYKAEMTSDFKIEHNKEQMLHTMNSCFLMQGTSELHLRKSNFSADIDSLQHHNIYAPETAYDLLISKDVHVFHLAIDRQYYAGLLCEKERNSAQIKQKLL